MTTACTILSSLLTRSPVASFPWKISVWEKSATGQSSTALSSSPPTTKWSRPARLILRVKWWRENTPFIACQPRPKRRRMSGSSVSSELSFFIISFIFKRSLEPPGCKISCALTVLKVLHCRLAFAQRMTPPVLNNSILVCDPFLSTSVLLPFLLKINFTHIG